MNELENKIYDMICARYVTFRYTKKIKDMDIWRAYEDSEAINRREARNTLIALCQKGLIIAKLSSDAYGYIDFHVATPTEIVAFKQGKIKIPSELTN